MYCIPLRPIQENQQHGDHTAQTAHHTHLNDAHYTEDKSHVDAISIYPLIETERSLGWLPRSSLETLKLAFNVSNDDRGSHPDDPSFSSYKYMYMYDD